MCWPCIIPAKCVLKQKLHLKIQNPSPSESDSQKNSVPVSVICYHQYLHTFILQRYTTFKFTSRLSTISQMGFSVENTADDKNSSSCENILHDHLFCLIASLFQTQRSNCVLDINTTWSGWTAYSIAIMPCTVTSPICDPEARQHFVIIVSKTDHAGSSSFGAAVARPKHSSCLRYE